MDTLKRTLIETRKRLEISTLGTLLNYLYSLYKTRVEADSGTINNVTITQDAYRNLPQIDKIKFAWMAGAGSKKRTSTIYSYFSKLYSLDTLAVHNDATQTTEASQPRVTGNIAPGDVEALQNQNGESRFITHPTISFAANEAWSVTSVLNNNWSNANNRYFISGGSNTLLGFLSSGQYSIRNEAGTIISGSNAYEIIGKRAVITYTAEGNGAVKISLNGTLKTTLTIMSSVSFARLLFAASSLGMEGNMSSLIIRNIALTASEVSAEATFLRTKYPEIPQVTIGSQTWALRNCDMVVTPQGNVIANVTENANVEKITNAADREFSSDTGFWTKDAGITIGGGTLVFTNVADANGFQRSDIVSANKWHKIIYTISDYISGGIAIRFPFSSVTRNANGTYTEYIYSNDATGSTAFRIKATSANTTLKIDNISVQEVGWAGSQELYDGIYAQTSGTTEQKTYAAVKAAAMWSFYNNSADNGAIYGKLYNWFAVKLLQMDIDYYNAANPTTPWGWRVPTSTDFTNLATALGGESVAGGKMKMTGLNYWTTPNEGADNSSGFTALGAGYRQETDGLFTSIKSHYMINSSSESGSNAYKGNSRNDFSTFVVSASSKIRGISLRLIKS